MKHKQKILIVDDHATNIRILEEILRTFRAHSGASVFDRLIRTGVLEVVLPEVSKILDLDISSRFPSLPEGKKLRAGRHLLAAFQLLDRADAPLVHYLTLLFLPYWSVTSPSATAKSRLSMGSPSLSPGESCSVSWGPTGPENQPSLTS